MPRQNRVTPFGAVIAAPERGTLMGNRGVLHDSQGGIRRAWQVKRWLLCLLRFKGRQRQVMTPGHYTELFFLDEATGLAAGHRPCAECRRDRYLAFCRAWLAGNQECRGPKGISASVMDGRLHGERVGLGGSKRTFSARLEDLPDGVFVRLAGAPDQACLVWGGWLLLWSPGGYRQRQPCPRGEQVEVLTPRSTVAAIRAGYVPEVHQEGR